ncbi:MAG: ABC transporter ATP-binding protein/permease [Oscillospiraceae bacterium]|nr:ABC transporter ATP-binding protein/permease [Oscillospiraceae bacterium]
MTILKFCKSYMFSHKRVLILYFILTMSGAFAGIASPYITGRFLDSLIYGTEFDVIVRFSIIFGIINIVSIVINYAASQLYIKLQTSVVFELNRDVIKHVQNLSVSFINNQDTAYLTQKVNNDSREIMMFCINVLRDSTIYVLLLIVPFAILVALNWIIGLALLVFLFLYFAMYFAFKKPLYKMDFIYKEKQSAYFASLYEQFSLTKKIKIESIQNVILGRLDKTFIGVRDSAIKKQRLTHLFTSSDSIVLTLAQIALFAIGGVQIFNNNFTVGMFTMFFSYFNMILSSSRYFYNVSAVYQNALVAHNRITELLGKKQESCGVLNLNDITSISTDNICFGYGEHNVIKGLTTVLSKGGIYGVVGHNGSGKSTLINLILGLYIDETNGGIAYDNINIRDIDMVSVRRNLISFAEQEPSLINGTIRYNLIFDDDDGELDYYRLEKYSEILDMKEFIDTKTINYVVSEKSNNTSGGEKQKISILKVLYRDTPIMIFDEPTSALDSVSSKRLIDYLNQIKKDKIIIIITHDERIINRCTSLLTLNGDAGNVKVTLPGES